MNIPVLNRFLKTDQTMSRYYVEGKQIRLGKLDFKAQGGEGAIYVKGSTAYKIYSDPQRTLQAAKIQELSVLTEPNIIRPLNLLLNQQNRAVGYTMRYVGKTHALCQLFPKAFRLRNNLKPEMSLELVRKLQRGVAHIHSHHILLVDLNEMNFLVTSDFSDLFFIDVDSYQTPSFPATVLMESVRDRHARTFSVGSDWFSFAVVSFQMFVGIHPFKGTYATLQQLSDKQQKLDARMRGNISVLHQGVTVPGSTLPFTVIPPAYLDWYRAVFEEGKRLPPPHDVRVAVQLSTTPTPIRVESGVFVVTKFREFDGEVIWHDATVTLTGRSIYFAGNRFDKPTFDVKLTITPRQRHLIAVFVENTRLRFRDLTTGKEIVTEVDGEEVMISNGNVYLKKHEHIFAVDFIELPQSLLLGLRPVANVMMQATQLFEGVAIQNLLGTKYTSIPTPSGACHQVRLPELDADQILNARIEKNVLIVVTTRAGQYQRFIYRFADDFSSYDVRVVVDIASTDINFTVLDSGVALHLIDGKMELFSTEKHAASVRTLRDPLLETDVRLFHQGNQALIARGNKLYKISLRT
jgi:hypothetical protein